MEVLNVENLSFRYGEALALDGVSFSIEEGEIFAVVGPNGGGKSTLFRLLSTLILPQSGRIEVLGFDTGRYSLEVRRGLGVVFQNPALDKVLTVDENLRTHGALFGMAKSEITQRIDVVLTTVGLRDKHAVRVSSLSGGQKRRVEIAKSLLSRPRLLLLDEPTTGLDPEARREVWTTLRKLSREERLTVCLTTHLLDEAEACDRVLMIDRGKVVALGKPETLCREAGESVVSVALSENSQLQSGPLGSIDWRESGDRFVYSGSDAFEVGRRALELESIRSLQVGRASLEDFYFSRTGRKWVSA